MSAPGQTRLFNGVPMTSGLPPEADIGTPSRHVSKVPNAAYAVQQTTCTGTHIRETEFME